MHVFYTIIGLLVVFNLIGINGSLKRLTDHNLKFPSPESEEPEAAPEDDTNTRSPSDAL